MLREVAYEKGVDEQTYNRAMDLRKMAQGKSVVRQPWPGAVRGGGGCRQRWPRRRAWQLLQAPASAEAATTAAGFYISGAGYGHGVGMSQYGALGFAQHGYGYRAILSHYYRDTSCRG